MKTNSFISQITCRPAARGAMGTGRHAWSCLAHLNFFGAVLVLLAAGTFQTLASDPIGIYALVDKVVLEPNEANPERIQIHGAFALAEGYGVTYAKAQRGMLYFKLNEKKPDVCKKEWADLKAMAGKGQIVAFGTRWDEKGTLRKEKAKPENPDTYPLGFGLTKVTKRDYKPIKELLALHDVKATGRDKPKNVEE